MIWCASTHAVHHHQPAQQHVRAGRPPGGHLQDRQHHQDGGHQPSPICDAQLGCGTPGRGQRKLRASADGGGLAVHRKLLMQRMAVQPPWLLCYDNRFGERLEAAHALDKRLDSTFRQPPSSLLHWSALRFHGLCTFDHVACMIFKQNGRWKLSTSGNNVLVQILSVYLHVIVDTYLHKQRCVE